ncbi:hypothetical protein ACFL6Q_02705 [Candidatus Neomarinimicrobiota bacterium]
MLAHNRVQMTLDTAIEKAEREFETTLAGTGKSLSELKNFVDEHPQMTRPIYPVPEYDGIVGKAARFVRHVSDLMDGKARLPNGHQ